MYRKSLPAVWCQQSLCLLLHACAFEAFRLLMRKSEG
jgi:hypothetical protein